MKYSDERVCEPPSSVNVSDSYKKIRSHVVEAESFDSFTSDVKFGK